MREAEWIQHNQNVGRGITADSAFFARSLNTAFLTQAQARQ
ncbi:hypothetical protein [Nocardia puris]|nr:hypothetical protein [Nocardia puris]